MYQRIDTYAVNPKAVNLLASASKHMSSIDKKLKALVELRISQINGCVYCVDLHSREARAEGENQKRLDTAEALTNVSVTHAPDAVFEELKKHYSEQQIVDLTLIISIMNMWNRIAVGMRRLPDE
jgi:AhpD family alkylhydroperoxidase